MSRSNTRFVPDDPKINNICQILKAFKQAICAYNQYHVFCSLLPFESVSTVSLWNRHSPLCSESLHLQCISGQASLRPFREHFWNSPSSSGSSASVLSSPSACFSVSLLAGSIFQFSSWRIKLVPIAENFRQRRLISRSPTEVPAIENFCR